MTESKKSAFMNLYQPVHEGFVRYCSARTYGIMETEDLVQETVAIAFERFEGLRDEKAFLAYLMRTANNLFVSQLRRKKFSGVYCENAFEKLKSIAPSAEVAMDVHHLYKAIEKLDKKSQEAIVLFEISGFKIDEIAEIQKCGSSAVKVRLHRARKQLKKELLETADIQHLLLSLSLLYTLKN